MQERLVYCYPVRLAVPSPPLPNVEIHVENNVVCVRYKGEMVKVSRSYFSKLVGGSRERRVRWGGQGQGQTTHPHPLHPGVTFSPSALPQWLLYRYSCIDDSGFERFLPRVWCLLRRYQVCPALLSLG